MKHDALSILKQFWHYDAFRYPQLEIINSIANHRDVIALLPTGSGKSICFQVPTLTNQFGVCLVISPLIALMKDQIDQLKSKGIDAEMISGFVTDNELMRIFDNIIFGKTRFLYVAPERLQSEIFIEKIRQIPLTLIAIDEAHCISEWGHDFRPSYLKINVLRDIFPHVNIIALTATATQEVIDDIDKYLKLNQPQIFKIPLTRSNIAYKVIESSDKRNKLLQQLSAKESVIIYAGTRKNVENTSSYLNFKGFTSVYYHAGLTPAEKENAYKLWKNNKCNIMVATNAFGMGIDKPDVRKVIHTALPSSIENYVQESGRAGRDGKFSEAIIIEDSTDLRKTEELFSYNLPDNESLKKIYNTLNQYFRIGYGDLPENEFTFSLSELSARCVLPSVKVFNTLEVLEHEGIIALSHHKEEQYFIQFLTHTEHLHYYYEKKKTKELIIKYLLRNYEGILEHKTMIFPNVIADNLSITKDNLIKNIIEMEKDGVVYYQNFSKSNGIKFLVPRQDQYVINPILHHNQKRIDSKILKYKNLIDYVLQKTKCRNKVLSEYFSTMVAEDCGVCDVCLSESNTSKVISPSIILQLINKNPLTIQELIHNLEANEQEVIITVRKMLKNEQIILNTLQQLEIYEP